MKKEDEKKFAEELLQKIRWKFAEEDKLDDNQAEAIIKDVVFEDSRTEKLMLDDIHNMIKYLFFKTRRRLGILQPLIEDESITEIMVNGYRNIFIERNGSVESWDNCFDDEDELEEIIRNIAGDVHREINEMKPVLDARLPDGSRVNAVYKNVAVNGPILTIRKFLDNYMNMKELVDNDTITEEGAVLLEGLTAAGYNIFISGGTSSGKTTLVNALAEAIPGDERVIVIEDSMELKLPYIDNIVHLECRNGNSSGHGRVDMANLIKSSLRMRPDRIIVGEVRGGEVVEMIQAMNTGHAGSLSTGHGNSAEGMLRRLESMYMMAAPQSIDAIRRQLAEGIDVLVHLEKMAGGKRKVVEITEISGYSEGEFILNRIMQADEEGILKSTGKKLSDCRKIYSKGEYYAKRLQQYSFI